MEKAKALGIKVDIIHVQDDCSLSVNKVVGRKGLAGTILVHKVHIN